MEEENLVTEVTENVEETTEQTTGAEVETMEQTEVVDNEPEKLYTEDDFNKRLDEVLAKKIARREAKIRKEYDRKYSKLENVLRAGTGKESLDDITDTFADFYTSKGIEIPNMPVYDDDDLQDLAEGRANRIINAGFDEVAEEVDRLMAVGLDNMTPTEKATFQKLATYRQNTERRKELAKIGVKEEEYNSKEFQDFASKFNSSTSITDVYRLYEKTQQKPRYEQVGSMKSTPTNKVKEHYTPDEISRMTLDDLDDPNVWEAVRKSMTGQN